MAHRISGVAGMEQMEQLFLLNANCHFGYSPRSDGIFSGGVPGVGRWVWSVDDVCACLLGRTEKSVLKAMLNKHLVAQFAAAADHWLDLEMG